MKSNNTDYIFPETASIDIMEIPTENPMDLPIRFAMLDVELNDRQQQLYTPVRDMLRQTRSVTLAHAPQLFSDEDSGGDTHLIVSFHNNRTRLDNLSDPLMVFILTLETASDLDTLELFGDRILTDGHVCLSVTLKNQVTVLSLMELFGVAPPIQNDDFSGIMSVLGVESRFFGEYMPPLDDPGKTIIHAVKHYRQKNQALIRDQSAVNLTGLIPEGLA